MKLFSVLVSSLCLCLFIFCGSLPASGAEVVSTEYGKAVSPGSENEILFFGSGANGEANPAYLEHLARVKSKEQLDYKLPVLKDARISFLEVSPMLTLPGHSLWTFRLAGLGGIPVGQTVRLSLEKTPNGLLLPEHLKVDSAQFANFNWRALRGISRDATLPDSLAVSGDRLFFEKKITKITDFIDISLVATSKASDCLIEVTAEVPGYRQAGAMLPGPSID